MTFRPLKHWQLLDAAKAKSWPVKPIEWLIEDMIARGNFVLVAAPTQTGKTLLCMYIAPHLVRGGKLFGQFAIKPVGKILYLSMEDPPRRIKERIADYGIQMPPKSCLMIRFCPGFSLNDKDQLDWLEDDIVKQEYDVVFLDTWQRATSGAASYDDVQQTPLLHALADITRERGITFIVIDHLRKTGVGKPRKNVSIDDIKGTSAKAQNADCIILMERSGQEITVRVSSKDTDKQLAFSLRVREMGGSGPKFEYLGAIDAAAVTASVTGKKNRLKVQQALDAEFRSSSEIAKAAGLPQSSVRRHLQSLVKGKQAETRGKGRWQKYRLAKQAA